MPKNLVGRSLNRAIAITSNQTVRNRVSASNRTDLFQFSLGSPQQLRLKFRSTNRNSQINLIFDQNQNGFVDPNEVLKQAKMHPKNGSINLAGAQTGTYFVQVHRTGRGSNQYQFNLVTTPISTVSSTIGSLGSSPSASNIVNEIVNLTNSYRQQNGLAPLTLNSRLSNAAQTHTQNMAFQDFVSHVGVDGASVGHRVSATGYQWSLVAENIAAGYQTAADVVQGWIDSPGHRANLLNPTVTEIGVGYYFLANDPGNATWNHYWTQVFGAAP
jgi:uncharacterized protein YkwD